MSTVYMYDASSNRPHAYSTDGGESWYLAKDNTWWAWRSGNDLWGADGSGWLVYQRGEHFYDAKTNGWAYYLAG